MTQQEFSKRYVYDASTDELGGGGFAHVYKAWDNEEECFVALKIQPVDSRYPDLRLKNEVDRAASLRHPNIARYKACYTFSTFDGNKDIAVMSYYEHGSLDKLLCSQRLTDAEREDILKQILAGIDYLHSQGIIHRDLKPQNILVLHHGGRYVPKITDFGISKQLADGESSAVHNSILGGTYSYASPEQLKETTIRKNTDLWSFGVIAYQMFAGVLPFNCGTFSPTSQEGRQEQFRQMTSGVLPEALNNIPEPWQTLIRECLVVDNTQRLTHVADCMAIIGIQPTSIDKPVEVKATDERTIHEKQPKYDNRSNHKSRWWLWLLITILLLAIGGAMGYLMLGNDTPEPTPSSSTGGENVVNADSLRAIERQDSLRRVEELEQRRLDSLIRVDRERFVCDSIRERRRLDSLNRVDAASLRLNSGSVDVGYDGGSNSVSYRLENSLDYLKVECTTNKSWITDIKSSNNKISFTVKANREYKSRSGIITVDYGTKSYSITVKQAARPAPTFTLDKSSLTVGSSGGSHSVGYTIEHPINGASVSVSDDKSWITNTSASGGKITFKTTDNTSTESRTGTITATYNGITRQITVTQGAGPININGHTAVDLGLSVKWATCNVGATNPEGYGDYFAWGETSPMTSYTEYNSKIGNKSMGDIGGDSRYDAATVNWGRGWRLPTWKEFGELKDNCTWTWTTRNGVNGYEVKSKKNGNSIFLPAAGYCYGGTPYYQGSRSEYWSSTPYSSYAYSLLFDSSGPIISWSPRYYGLSVRPVSE